MFIETADLVPDFKLPIKGLISCADGRVAEPTPLAFGCKQVGNSNYTLEKQHARV
jgi:hypothetical protein